MEVKIEKKEKLLNPPLTSQVSRDWVFEGLPPNAQFVRLEAG